MCLLAKEICVSDESRRSKTPLCSGSRRGRCPSPSRRGIRGTPGRRPVRGTSRAGARIRSTEALRQPLVTVAVASPGREVLSRRRMAR